MSLGKQAKILSKAQIQALLHHVSSKRLPERNRVIVLLSTRAGLRAKEIANLKWANVTGSDGSVGDLIHVTDDVAKGKSGRVIPINKHLRSALVSLHSIHLVQSAQRPPRLLSSYVIESERSSRTSAQVIVNTMSRWFSELGFEGASSHSGRRTFITNAAKKVFEAGGSLRDVQQLAGHKSLAMTQRYIEGDSEAKRRLVDLI